MKLKDYKVKVLFLIAINLALVYLILSLSNLWKNDYTSISKTKWSVVRVTSEEVHANQLAKYAIDDKFETFWHSEWVKRKPPLPQYIIVDMGKTQKVSGFYYNHRLDGDNGRVHKFNLYVGKTLADLEKSLPILSETISIEASTKVFQLDNPEIRYFKFEIIKEVFGKNYSSVGELGFYEAR